MHYNGPIAAQIIVGTSPQLDLVVSKNGHAINFFRAGYYTLRNTNLILALGGYILDKMKGLHHKIIEYAWIGILGCS